MGFRLSFLRSQPEDESHYTEGYNAGYTAACDEMLRHTRSHYPVEPEDRRGARSEEFSPARRHIGFIDGTEDSHAPQFPVHAVMEMMKEIRDAQQNIMRGMGEFKQTLDPRLDGVLESAMRVLDHPPITWEPYLEKHDYHALAKMEGKELLSALEAKKPMKDIRKELTHTIAALFKMASA